MTDSGVDTVRLMYAVNEGWAAFHDSEEVRTDPKWIHACPKADNYLFAYWLVTISGVVVPKESVDALLQPLSEYADLRNWRSCGDGWAWVDSRKPWTMARQAGGAMMLVCPDHGILRPATDDEIQRMSDVADGKLSRLHVFTHLGVDPTGSCIRGLYLQKRGESFEAEVSAGYGADDLMDYED